VGDLPKITLLQPGWTDYTLIMGKRRYVLHGGVSVPMPVAAALRLMRRRNARGQPLFTVEGLEPQVVETARPAKAAGHVPNKKRSGGMSFGQMELAACVS